MRAMTFAVKKVGVEEDKKGDRKGCVVLKHAGLRGECQLKLMVEEEDAESFRMGEFYELNLKQVEPPTD